MPYPRLAFAKSSKSTLIQALSAHLTFIALFVGVVVFYATSSKTVTTLRGNDTGESCKMVGFNAPAMGIDNFKPSMTYRKKDDFKKCSKDFNSFFKDAKVISVKIANTLGWDPALKSFDKTKLYFDLEVHYAKAGAGISFIKTFNINCKTDAKDSSTTGSCEKMAWLNSVKSFGYQVTKNSDYTRYGYASEGSNWPTDMVTGTVAKPGKPFAVGTFAPLNQDVSATTTVIPGLNYPEDVVTTALMEMYVNNFAGIYFDPTKKTGAFGAAHDKFMSRGTYDVIYKKIKEERIKWFGDTANDKTGDVCNKDGINEMSTWECKEKVKFTSAEIVTASIALLGSLWGLVNSAWRMAFMKNEDEGGDVEMKSQDG